MQESCPACGGSTKVGTTGTAAGAEKSRRRASGASNTTSCGEVQQGRRRVPSWASCAGIASRAAGDRTSDTPTRADSPSAVAWQASAQASKRAPDELGEVTAGPTRDVLILAPGLGGSTCAGRQRLTEDD